MRISDWSSDVCSSDLNFIQRATLNRTHFDLFYGALRVDGDDTQAMKVVADRLRQLTRPQDFLARYGRFEFALLRFRDPMGRSEEHTSELQSLMRISYAVFCLKKNNYAAMILRRLITTSSHHNRKNTRQKTQKTYISHN